MKFAEFRIGQLIEAGPHTVDEEEIVRYASAWDPQWFHVDAEAAANSRFGGLIASGWHTCAIAMRLAVDAVLHDSESFASPGMNYVEWPHPVRPGDRLTLLATVIEARRSTARPTLGVLRWRWQPRKDGGVDVLDLEATSLFDLGAAAR